MTTGLKATLAAAFVIAAAPGHARPDDPGASPHQLTASALEPLGHDTSVARLQFAAFNSYMTVKGMKQGAFKGESPRETPKARSTPIPGPAKARPSNQKRGN